MIVFSSIVWYQNYCPKSVFYFQKKEKEKSIRLLLFISTNLIVGLLSKEQFQK